MIRQSKKKEQRATLLTLTPRQVGQITGFGMNAVYSMLRTGEMPSIKSGKKFFVPRAALMKWLANCGEKTAQTQSPPRGIQSRNAAGHMCFRTYAKNIKSRRNPRPS